MQCTGLGCCLGLKSWYARPFLGLDFFAVSLLWHAAKMLYVQCAGQMLICLSFAHHKASTPELMQRWPCHCTNSLSQACLTYRATAFVQKRVATVAALTSPLDQEMSVSAFEHKTACTLLRKAALTRKCCRVHSCQMHEHTRCKWCKHPEARLQNMLQNVYTREITIDWVTTHIKHQAQTSSSLVWLATFDKWWWHLWSIQWIDI